MRLYQNDCFYVSNAKSCCRANVVMEDNDNSFCQSLCVPDYYRIRVSMFHIRCQLTCLKMPSGCKPRFHMILYIKFSKRFPTYLVNVKSLYYCRYNLFPELHIFLNNLLGEFDPYMLNYVVSQETWCLSNASLFSELLRASINCYV